MKTYAQISAGTVINLINADPGDTFDPTYTFVDLTSISPIPQIGWTYDGSVFTNPTPAQTLTQAQQQNLLRFQAAVQVLVTNAYSLDIRFNFMAMYTLAVQNGLTNRATYIIQLFTWAQSVVSYCAVYQASILAMTDVSTVNSTTWDFTQIAANPMITTSAAIQILN